MAAKTTAVKSTRTSDEAVQAKTGKTWKEWFAILDKAGAARLDHQEIVKLLHTKHGVGPWWQQMVTVTYEQARGLRKLHQKPGGYEISVSRTIKVSLGKAFKSVANDQRLQAWLNEQSLAIRTSTLNKTIRFDWIDSKTTIELSFLPKGDDKTQVVATHRKIPNAKASLKLKTYWGKALDRLRSSLEL